LHTSTCGAQRGVAWFGLEDLLVRRVGQSGVGDARLSPQCECLTGADQLQPLVDLRVYSRHEK
jgi:hypothetical protein